MIVGVARRGGRGLLARRLHVLGDVGRAGVRGGLEPQSRKWRRDARFNVGLGKA